MALLAGMYCILICISNNIHQNMRWLQQQILTARAFLVHLTDWLKQTTTFVKFKLFQDQRFQNHSAKNLEMCKDWFRTSLLKIYNNQQK